jgi:hypothetical protein
MIGETSLGNLIADISPSLHPISRTVTRIELDDSLVVEHVLQFNPNLKPESVSGFSFTDSGNYL